ncbi:MAG: cell wall-binding repeat-containing protein [Clostridium botulinum]|uniref:cell wall-binding repeat-containing protein n=1 Tax=uncultured Clostridium sp. TaxID=59620 RepID=UPI00280BBE81|nr:cell wall-binding repeat-containing protein [uncultured Clostridium sp.]MDU6878641.1 cell wall-binding repeat-containing protein [Clostridium botulinum]
MKSLKQILKYYDIGGFTCYDLGYITKNREKPHIAVNYHGVHIYLLNALYSITNDRVLYDYYKLWKAYVDTTEVDRISGVNRYETNANISKEFTKEGINTIILASGENYADALSAVPLASKNKWPILLAESNSIDSFTINEIKRLNPNKIIVIGGEGAISQKVCNDIKKINKSIVFERIGGKDRYETNTKVLNRFIDELDLSKVYVAIGGPSNMDYADLLSCAPLAAISKSPILLVPTTRQIPKSLTDFAYDNLENNTNIIAIGGKAILPNYKINSIVPEK